MVRFLTKTGFLLLKLATWIKQKNRERKTNFRHFRKAVRKAERLAVEKKRRYRVFLFDEYIVTSRDDMQTLKKRGYISKKDNTGVLSNLCLYDTLGSTNMHPEFQERRHVFWLRFDARLSLLNN